MKTNKIQLALLCILSILSNIVLAQEKNQTTRFRSNKATTRVVRAQEKPVTENMLLSDFLKTSTFAKFSPSEQEKFRQMPQDKTLGYTYSQIEQANAEQNRSSSSRLFSTNINSAYIIPLPNALCCVIGRACCVSTQPASCPPVENTSDGSTSVQNPCGIAFSTTGKVAITTYLGFTNGYGAVAPVRVYASTSDFQNGINPILVGNNNDIKAPEAVVFDAQGNLYVAETEGCACVSVFSPNDNYATRIKQIWGGFNNPRGLAIDASGNLYVADDGNGRIAKVTNPTNNPQTTTLKSGLSSPKSIAIAGDFLYVGEYNANKISRYTLSNINATPLTATCTKPIDMTIKKDCVLYVSQHGTKSVLSFDATSLAAKSEHYGSFGELFGVGIDANSNIYVTDFYNNRVVRYMR